MGKILPFLYRKFTFKNYVSLHLKLFSSLLVAVCGEFKIFFFFPFIFISWRLITLQYCSGFCHTLTWISHGFTCIPHPDSPSHLPLYQIPLGFPSAPGRNTCLCFTLDNIHVSMLFSRNIPPSPSPTESKILFCTSVFLFLFCIED